ncbi:MAG: hypothetical protein Q4D02_05055 [Clostridia bacterium]|nr:hypothetical protein [Clostridia bacterium]
MSKKLLSLKLSTLQNIFLVLYCLFWASVFLAILSTINVVPGTIFWTILLFASLISYFYLFSIIEMKKEEERRKINEKIDSIIENLIKRL